MTGTSRHSKKINEAFSGNDATTSKLPTVEHLKAAIDLLSLDDVPSEAKDVAIVATTKYLSRLHGAIYFILAYNLHHTVIEHRACALSAAMRRPPFSDLSDGDPKHKATFEAVAALVLDYVRRVEREPPSPGKKWLPWTVPTRRIRDGRSQRGYRGGARDRKNMPLDRRRFPF